MASKLSEVARKFGRGEVSGLSEEEAQRLVLDPEFFEGHCTKDECPVHFTLSRPLAPISNFNKSVEDNSKYPDNGMVNWNSVLRVHYELEDGNAILDYVCIDDAVVMLKNPRSLSASSGKSAFGGFGSSSKTDDYAKTYIKIGFPYETVAHVQGSVRNDTTRMAEFKVTPHSETGYVWINSNFETDNIPAVFLAPTVEAIRESELDIRIPKDYDGEYFIQEETMTPYQLMTGEFNGYWMSTVYGKLVLTVQVPKGKTPKDVDAGSFNINFKVNTILLHYNCGEDFPFPSQNRIADTRSTLLNRSRPTFAREEVVDEFRERKKKGKKGSVMAKVMKETEKPKKNKKKAPESPVKPKTSTKKKTKAKTKKTKKEESEEEAEDNEEEEEEEHGDEEEEAPASSTREQVVETVDPAMPPLIQATPPKGGKTGPTPPLTPVAAVNM